MIVNLFLNAVGIKRVGHIAANARFHGGRRNQIKRVRERPWMENLHANFHIGIGRMNSICNEPVLLRLFIIGHCRATAR